VFGLVCAANLIWCLRALRRNSRVALGSFIWSAVSVLIFVPALMLASNHPSDYVRESLQRDVPEGLPVQVEAWNWGGHRVDGRIRTVFEARVTTTTDVVSLAEFEAFVTRMQPLMTETMQRRRVRRFGLTVMLDTPDGRNVVTWNSSFWLARDYGHAVGDYGELFLRNDPEWVSVIPMPYLDFRDFGFELPLTSIQETLDTLADLNEFAKALTYEMYPLAHINVDTIGILHDEPRLGRTRLRGVEPGKAHVRVSQTWEPEQPSPIYLSNVGASLMGMNEQVQSVAQQHDVEVISIRISLWPDGLPRSVIWESESGDEHGTFTIGGATRNQDRTFYDVRLVEIQGLLSEELAETMAEENRIVEAYRRLNDAFVAANHERFGPLRYVPLSELLPGHNDSGLCVNLILFLRYYEHSTGTHLAYRTVVNYFSQEFEPDGSVRLYNNGYHPEIEAFVEWVSETANWEHVPATANIVEVFEGPAILLHNPARWLWPEWEAFRLRPLTHELAGTPDFHELSPQTPD